MAVCRALCPTPGSLSVTRAGFTIEWRSARVTPRQLPCVQVGPSMVSRVNGALASWRDDHKLRLGEAPNYSELSPRSMCVQLTSQKGTK